MIVSGQQWRVCDCRTLPQLTPPARFVQVLMGEKPDPVLMERFLRYQVSSDVASDATQGDASVLGGPNCSTPTASPHLAYPVAGKARLMQQPLMQVLPGDPVPGPASASSPAVLSVSPALGLARITPRTQLHAMASELSSLAAIVR